MDTTATYIVGFFYSTLSREASVCCAKHIFHTLRKLFRHCEIATKVFPSRWETFSLYVLCLHFTAMKYIPKLSWRMKSQNIKGEPFPCTVISRAKTFGIRKWEENWGESKTFWWEGQFIFCWYHKIHTNTLFQKSIFCPKINLHGKVTFLVLFWVKILIFDMWNHKKPLRWIKVHFSDQNWTFNIVWRCGLSLENAIAQRKSRFWYCCNQTKKK